MGVVLISNNEKIEDLHLNWWIWRTVVAEIARTQTLSVEKIELLGFNVSPGLDAVDASAVAMALAEVVREKMVDQSRLMLDGEVTKESDTQEFYRDQPERNYSAKKDHLLAVANFCKRSKGFSVG